MPNAKKKLASQPTKDRAKRLAVATKKAKVVAKKPFTSSSSLAKALSPKKPFPTRDDVVFERSAPRTGTALPALSDEWIHALPAAATLTFTFDSAPSSLDAAEVADFFHLVLQAYGKQRLPLEVHRISYASPLEIWFYGVSTALIGAAVLAGGEVSILGLKVKLSMPLGEAVRKLRAALAAQEQDPDFSEKPSVPRKRAAKKVPNANRTP